MSQQEYTVTEKTLKFVGSLIVVLGLVFAAGGWMSATNSQLQIAIEKLSELNTKIDRNTNRNELISLEIQEMKIRLSLIEQKILTLEGK